MVHSGCISRPSRRLRDRSFSGRGEGRSPLPGVIIAEIPEKSGIISVPRIAVAEGPQTRARSLPEGVTLEKRLTGNELVWGLLVWSALLGAGWIAWQILSPFLVPLAWAGLIAFATYGPYRAGGHRQEYSRHGDNSFFSGGKERCDLHRPGTSHGICWPPPRTSRRGSWLCGGWWW